MDILAGKAKSWHATDKIVRSVGGFWLGQYETGERQRERTDSMVDGEACEDRVEGTREGSDRQKQTKGGRRSCTTNSDPNTHVVASAAAKMGEVAGEMVYIPSPKTVFRSK